MNAEESWGGFSWAHCVNTATETVNMTTDFPVYGYASCIPLGKKEILGKLKEFWGVPDDYRTAIDIESHEALFPELPASLSEFRHLLFDCSYINGEVHPGAARDICDYLKLPLPFNGSSWGISKLLVEKTQFWRKMREAVWKDVLEEFPDDVEARNAKYWIKDLIEHNELINDKLEKAVEEIMPYAMRAYDTKLESARMRALWGILLLELQVGRAIVKGLKA